MTHRERQLAAIRREPTDRPSVDAICIEIMPQIGAYLGVSECEVPDALGLDGRITAAGWLDTHRPEWTGATHDHYGSVHAYPLADADAHAIEAYPWPDPDTGAYDWSGAAHAAAAMQAAGYAVRGPYWRPVFDQACALTGMETMLVWMLEEPELAERLLERVAAVQLAYVRRYLDACGDALDILYLGDDFASQRGLMMSPAVWRRYIASHLAALFAEGVRRGKPVWFHSCGDITAVLPDLIGMGVNVWETVQLHALPLSAAELKREYGAHLCFFGGISTQHLPGQSPDDVRSAVRAAKAALGPTGYICGPDHHIKPDVTPELAVVLFETAREPW